MNDIDVSGLKGKKVVVGFGKDTNRLVITWEGGGITFFAGSKGLEAAKPEPISLGITPSGVSCEEAGFSEKSRRLFLKLGRNRLLSASHMTEGDLHVVYLPDEADIEFGTSEFMQAVGS